MATTISSHPIELGTHSDLEKPAFVSSQMKILSDQSDDERSDSLATHHIISSPYQDATHRLDLRTLSDPVAGLAKALTGMTAILPEYATAAYDRSFNWETVASSFTGLSSTATPAWPSELSFYVIVFRSKLKLGADRDLLGRLDKAAHLEAVESGGLLKYWFGTPDVNNRNLATCLWRARDDARAGSAGSGHAAAMTAARTMYDEWFVERLRLTINLSSGSWKFTPWVDEPSPAHGRHDQSDAPRMPVRLVLRL